MSFINRNVLFAGLLISVSVGIILTARGLLEDELFESGYLYHIKDSCQANVIAVFNVNDAINLYEHFKMTGEYAFPDHVSYSGSTAINPSKSVKVINYLNDSLIIEVEYPNPYYNQNPKNQLNKNKWKTGYTLREFLNQKEASELLKCQ